MMNMILNIAVVAILIISVLILCCYGRTVLKGEISTPLFAFSAILFTSGLDVGLISLQILLRWNSGFGDFTYGFFIL